MLELVERELDWILDSPAFYGVEAVQHAQSQITQQNLISLPGPIVTPNNIIPLSTQECSSLIPIGAGRGECAQHIERELEHLKTGRLGLIFEKYLEIILRRRFGSKNVLCRVPVREPCQVSLGSKTWGEFDFLFFNNDEQRVEHWESSVKFYLQVKDDPAWYFCWGPGVQDRLDLKGPKTFLQQLPLSSTTSGAEAIPGDWRRFPLVKRVFAKGTIFYRWRPEVESFAERLGHIVAPHALSPDHLKSWWINMDDVESLRTRYPESMPALLPRRNWMVGLCGSVLNEQLESWVEFINKLSTRAAQASERKECLHVGLYSAHSDRRFLTSGFIATPHFVAAQ
jgi:hypothetical protein